MTITIIGSGNMARGIGTRLAAGGNAFTFYGQDAEQASALAADVGADSTTDLDRALRADVVILAAPYQANLQLAGDLAPRLAGKIVVDISNPLNATYDGLITEPGTSAAEEISKAAPEARVVKAFNTTFAGTLVSGAVSGQALDVFIAGNDDEAKATVAGLVEAGGLVAIDASIARCRTRGLAPGFRPAAASGSLGARRDHPRRGLRPGARRRRPRAGLGPR